MASPPLTNREYAYFTVRGTGSHLFVSSKLGVESTNEWSEGDIDSRNNRPRRFMAWNLESGLDDTHPIEEHIEKILNLIEPLKNKLDELSQMYELTIQCVGYFAGTGHGLHLDRDSIARISKLPVAIDYDYYFIDDNGHDLDYV